MFVSPVMPATPAVMTILSSFLRLSVDLAILAASSKSCSVSSYFLQSLGVTPQERARRRQVSSLSVKPIMLTGQRKREIILAVLPESVQATIAFAPISRAMPQVACEIASLRFLISKLQE